MRLPSFKPKSSEGDDDQGKSNDKSATPEPQGVQQKQELQNKDQGEKQDEGRKGGFFSRTTKEEKKDAKGSEPPGDSDLQSRDSDTKDKGRTSFSRRGKKKLPEEPLPAELVHVDGERVLVPSFDDLDSYKNITYPVMEPYQFVNLRYEDGVLAYRLIEPELTVRERAILKKVNEAFDMLVNVNTVLITTEDKLHFLEDTFKDILKIYSYKLDEITYRRILYHIERDYVGYG